MARNSIAISILVLLVVWFAGTGGCVTEDELARRVTEAREAGYEACQTACRIRIEAAVDTAYLRGVKETAQKAKVDLEMATKDAFEKGRRSAFYEVAIGTFKMAVHRLVGWGCALVLLLFILLLLEHMVLPDLAARLRCYIREKRWSAVSTFGQRRRIMVEKEKWDMCKRSLHAKRDQLSAEAASVHHHIKTYSDFMAQTMPAHQETLARRYIAESKARLQRIDALQSMGASHLNTIAGIQTGLDMALFRLENDSSVSLPDLFEEFDDLNNRIKDYLRWDIDEFDPPESVDDLDSFEVEDDPTAPLWPEKLSV